MPQQDDDREETVRVHVSIMIDKVPQSAVMDLRELLKTVVMDYPEARLDLAIRDSSQSIRKL